MSDLDVLRRVLAAARAGDTPAMEDLDIADAAIANGAPAAKVLIRERGKPGRKPDTPYSLADLRRVAAVVVEERQGTKRQVALTGFAGAGGKRKMSLYRGFVEWLNRHDMPLHALTDRNIVLFADAFEDEDDEFIREVLADK